MRSFFEVGTRKQKLVSLQSRLYYDGRIEVRKASVFLCGVLAAALLTGCGSVMPDLTPEETDLISEYAVGILLKYDKHHGGRLIDTSVYEDVAEAAEDEPPMEEPEPEQEQEPETSTDDTEVIDVSQDEELTGSPVTIEEYYGIQDITFQYLGYDLTQSYPSDADNENPFFAMDATEGEQLLVLRFWASNTTSYDQVLNMISFGARFRVSVNGGSSQNALTTMLLNDMQSYNDVVPAGSGVELVTIIEIPQSVPVGTIDFVLRGKDENATISLQ